MFLYHGDPRFELALERLTGKQSFTSSLYTKTGLAFSRERPIHEGKIISEKSLVLMWNHEPVIGLIAALIESDGKTDLQAFTFPCISIEDKEHLTDKASKIFKKEFDSVLNNVNNTVNVRDYLIDGEISILSRHLLYKGAKAIPKFSQIIDLGHSESRIKRDVRKSYRSLINWGGRQLNPRVLSSSNMSWKEMCAFRQLHIQTAGRETRSEESWRLQLEMVQAGEAFAVFGDTKNQLVSAGFFMHNHNYCYYGLSASRRDLFDKPMFHALLWIAVLHAKKIGCRWFELGEQLYPNQPCDNFPSKKELGISTFKAGFGGETKMFLDLRLDCEHLGK